MDDWQTIIYIIVGIVIFIFSASKGKKKQAAPPPKTNAQVKPLENILGNQLPPEWLEQQAEDVLEDELLKKDELGIAPEEEGSAIIHEVESLKDEVKPKKKKTIKKKKVKFDARKAVIYSSILNRKYK